MAWTIEYLKEAQKDLLSLDHSHRARARARAKGTVNKCFELKVPGS